MPWPGSRPGADSGGRTARVTKHEAALRDLVEHYVFLAESAGLETAERFLARAEASFRELGRFPEMGARIDLRNAALLGLRRWKVKEFETFLIFYLAGPSEVTIVRVLQGARDWLALIEQQ